MLLYNAHMVQWLSIYTPKDGPLNYIKLILVGQREELINDLRAGDTILSHSTLIINRPTKNSNQ